VNTTDTIRGNLRREKKLIQMKFHENLLADVEHFASATKFVRNELIY